MLSNPLSRLFLSFVKNHFQIDQPLKAILKVCGLKEEYFSHLSELGQYVGDEFLERIDYFDKHPLRSCICGIFMENEWTG